MRIHEVRFPNYRAEIATEKRTLFHMSLDGQWKVGDGLQIRPRDTTPFTGCKVGVLTDVRWVKLLAELDADLPKLCVTNRDEYLARWDKLHPGTLSVSDPVVCRIEFRYGMWVADPTDPPEWSLAV